MIKVQLRAGVTGVAEIEIYSPIGENWWGDGLTAKKFRSDLKALGTVSEIVVRINSPGGAVFDGFSIYNALKEHGARIVVRIDGLAASIASVIAMAGDEIVMGEGAMMMIHDPWSIAIGDSDDMRKAAEMLDKVKVGLVDAYEKRTKKKRAQIEDWMAVETWFTAEEAVEEGFADSRSQPDPEDPEEGFASVTRVAYAKSMWGTSDKFRAFAMAEVSKSPRPPAGSTLSASADATPQGETTMKPDPKATPSATEADPQAAADAATAAANKASQERLAGIRARFPGALATAHAVLLAECLGDAACTPEQAGEKLLAKLGAGAAPLNPDPKVQAGADARDKFIEGAAQALLARAGHGERDRANEFNGMGLADIAAHGLRLVGVSTKGMSRDAIARRALAAPMGSLTSSDFPQLMSNVAGKALQAAYGNYPDTWDQWAARGEVSDFKVHPRIQLGSFNSLDTIVEGGEYKYGDLTEVYEEAQAKTKGKGIILSRQMVVNDDLGAFTRRASLMGRAAARSVNADAYAYLTSGSSNYGPTSKDTGQVFNATAVTTAGGHANLTTSSGTAISVASLGVGRQKMRIQKDAGLRESLNIEPKILLCSTLKEDLARQIIVSETDPSSSNSKVPNIYRNAFKVVSDPALDGLNSGTRWYLFADPADVAAFEVVFLDGNSTPFVDDIVDFETDAMKFKVRLDYGIAIGDWRAAYLNTGA